MTDETREQRMVLKMIVKGLLNASVWVLTDHRYFDLSSVVQMIDVTDTFLAYASTAARLQTPVQAVASYQMSLLANPTLVANRRTGRERRLWLTTTNYSSNDSNRVVTAVPQSACEK